MTIYFTADHHFGHAGAINQNGRPFVNVMEMRETMIERWNEVVGADDTVYHLGDFAWRAGEVETQDIFARLNGQKHLVTGNHDHAGPAMHCDWETISQLSEVKVDGIRVVLCHYPLLEWRGFHRGVLNLFGHVHGSNPGVGRSCDVGVDEWGFRPVALPEILERIESRKPRPLTPAQQRQVARYSNRLTEIVDEEKAKWTFSFDLTRTAMDVITSVTPEARYDLRRICETFEGGWEREYAFKQIGEAASKAFDDIIEQWIMRPGKGSDDGN